MLRSGARSLGHKPLSDEMTGLGLGRRKGWTGLYLIRMELRGRRLGVAFERLGMRDPGLLIRTRRSAVGVLNSFRLSLDKGQYRTPRKQRGTHCVFKATSILPRSSFFRDMSA